MKNVCFFPFLGEKSTKCAQRGKMFSYITVLMFSKKNFRFSPFPVKFSILVKCKMAATFDDVTGPQQRHTS